VNRVEAADKVTGRARYAYECQGLDGLWPEPPGYVYPVQSTVARGHVLAVHAEDALAVPGVIAVLSCADPPELGSADDAELALFQSREIAYRGQLVAAARRPRSRSITSPSRTTSGSALTIPGCTRRSGSIRRCPGRQATATSRPG